MTLRQDQKKSLNTFYRQASVLDLACRHFPRATSKHLPAKVLASLLAFAVTGQAAADVISITGDITVTFNALGAGTISGTPALSYKTVGPVTTVGATKRAITVRLIEALPPGVTATVNFVPNTGNGTSMGPLTLSTSAQILVDLILADIEQPSKALNYTFNSSSGFTSVNIKVEYTLIDN
ncbi:hypothetical protein [Deinococcus peraridilitoris]|uniref:Uncharacterized protein n=1 Tax=Deinococcus peraridilitoris (strain DSM 19664 / LMG 22246 / CIP 109416 / KR-200) TaxID=937777 RepID=L0A0G4_DEIPD|nr:hypothetical protein [Deinococcus peraridilitoris]AFZ67336.1 hypothetical protein Deipe_1820 [Deinococcus peraridilitoris DSM 19664]